MTSPVSPAMATNGKMPMPGMPTCPPGTPQNSQQRQTQQDNHWHPTQMLPHISTNQIWQGLQAGEELIPVMAPQLAHFTPLISIGYAGRDIYSTFRHAYNKTEKLPLEARIRKIAADTGDVTLFHLFSTFLIPLLLAKKLGGWLMPRIENNPRLPEKIATHPKLATAGVLTVIAVALMNPVNAVVDFILDHSYRPLVEKRKRDKLRKEQEKLFKQYTQFKAQLPPFASSITWGSQSAVSSKSSASSPDKRMTVPFGAAFRQGCLNG